MTVVNKRLDEALETIDAAKRDSMRKLVVGAAFAAPVVASFAIDGMMVSPAFATATNSQISNSQIGNSQSSNQPPPP